MANSSPLPRRIAAIVLPELALELGRAHRRRGDREGPFAVIVADAPGEPAVEGNAVLAAVDVRAYRCGVRPGQSVAQAAAFVGKLEVAVVAPRAIEQALAAVAEVALAFGTTAALERTPAPAALSSAWGGAGAGPWSTVWLDVTGCARLVGGEDVLASELRQAAEELGHRARTALADGPRLAQIAARFLRVSVVPAGEGAAALAPVPVSALPLEEATLGWLGKLGLLSCGDLARLEPSRLAQRLGPRAAEVCALLEGRDTLPLVAYEPPPRIVETASFEDAVDAVEPLLFCTSGLVARAAVRLAARGRAAGRLALVLHGDPHLAAL
ncbi:MAG: DNA polymerase Y family protein, partial [Myxococcales bacterium]|nr:DNA polymerase Y family protein [Myxococcales bacterium]